MMSNADRLAHIARQHQTVSADLPWLVERVRQLEGAVREMLEGADIAPSARPLARAALDEDPFLETT
jgi:hypothetical protein